MAPMKGGSRAVSRGSAGGTPAWRPSRLRERSVDRDHHVRGLDDRVGGLAACQLEVVDSFVGDGRRNDRAPDIDAHMRGRLPLLHLDDLALENVACAELHGNLLSPSMSGDYVELRNVLASLLGAFEQLVEFDRAQIDLIKLAIKVARDLAHVTGKSTGRQQPRQPLHPYQPVERRWRVDPAVGEPRTEEHAAPLHGVDLRPRGIGSNMFGHGRIDGHDGIRLPADHLLQGDIVKTSAWEAALDDIDGADAFDDL